MPSCVSIMLCIRSLTLCEFLPLHSNALFPLDQLCLRIWGFYPCGRCTLKLTLLGHIQTYVHASACSAFCRSQQAMQQQPSPLTIKPPCHKFHNLVTVHAGRWLEGCSIYACIALANGSMHASCAECPCTEIASYGCPCSCFCLTSCQALHAVRDLCIRAYSC